MVFFLDLAMVKAGVEGVVNIGRLELYREHASFWSPI